MDFSWTDEQQQLFADAVHFANTRLVDDLHTRDKHSDFPAHLWTICADHGVLGWALPGKFGGAELPIVTAARLMEALGYGCRDNGLCFALGAQMWGTQMALSHFGTAHQIEHYLKPSMKGLKKGAYAMTETGSGSDAFSLETTATVDGDHYILSGEKVLVTFAPIADYAIVFASTDTQAGRWGLSAFVVDSDTPGYQALPNEEKMGLRTVPFGTIKLQDCRVPANAMLGKAGSGASIFTYSQSWERSLVLAPQVGAMQWQMEQCTDFSRQHKRAGVAIGSHQAVSHRIADMRIRLETARLLLYQTASLLQQGKQGLMEAAITKTVISEAFVESSQSAIAINGGAGYTTNAGIERNLRDAIGATIYGGTANIQRNIIAGLMGL